MAETLQPFDSEGLKTETIQVSIPEEIAECARDRREEFVEQYDVEPPSLEGFALDHVEIEVEV